VTAALVALAIAAAPAPAHAQDLEPRAYANTPVGMNFVLLGYAYSEGGVTTDPSVPLTNADIQVHQTFLGYARALNLWGLSGKFAAVFPYAWLSGTAEFAGQPGDREVSGFGDPKLQLSVNFYGAPALSLKEFADYKQDLIVGASLQVSVPVGQYDPDKLVNIGTNRWAVKPELGVSKAWGPLTLELMASATFYTDNDDFLGGQTREQDPLYAVQAHLIYSLPFGIWAALDGTYYFGGRTTVNGARSDDRQENTRLGATVALPVDPHNSVKLHASTGVTARTGSDFTTVGIAWQFRWGGGL
jgi:hypothetical protein